MIILVALLFIWMIFIQIKLNELDEKIGTKTTICREESGKTSQKPECVNNEMSSSTVVKQDIKIKEPVNGKKFDFETAFLGNIFNKIGAIALVIGIGIFVKVISPFLIFTPEMKVTLGYLAGVVIFGLGYKLKDVKLRNFKEVLCGTGISVLFVTTYCASAYFHLFNNFTSILIATLLLLCVYLIADRQKTISMIVIALIAGYLNPFLITSDVQPEFLFGYYILVNLLSCIYVFKNPKKALINFINLCLTFVFLTFAVFKDISSVNIIYPIALWLLYLVYDIARQKYNTDTIDKNNILNWVNYAVLTLFTIMIFNQQKAYIGYLTLSVGIIYAGLVCNFIEKKSKIYKTYLYSAVLCLFLSTFFLCNGVYRVFFWSLESALLGYAGIIFNIPALANWALGYVLSALTSLLFIENVVYAKDIEKYIPVWNIRTLAFAFPILSGYLTYKVLNTSEDKKIKKLSEVFRFTAFSLIYLYITFEVNNLIMKWGEGKFNTEFISAMLISIIGFKYALQAGRIYNSNKFKLFNYASYTIGGFALLMLLCEGYSYMPYDSFIPVFNVRFAAFAVGIATSYIFSRWNKIEGFKYLTLILGFLLVHTEASDFVDLHSNLNYLVTVSWLIYAGIITICGIFKNIKCLKYTGIWISIIAICRIFVFDLEGTDVIYKLVAFLTLGIILMLISYYYNKKRT